MCRRGLTTIPIRIMKTLRITIAVFTLLGVVAACGDDGTGTTSGTGVVFGEGEMPPAFPEDFPIPPNAVIGSTLDQPGQPSQ